MLDYAGSAEDRREHHLTYFIVKQLPVLPPERIRRAVPGSAIMPLRTGSEQRVLELTFTAWDMEAFARISGMTGRRSDGTRSGGR